jgi:hypothetical protein
MMCADAQPLPILMPIPEAMAERPKKGYVVRSNQKTPDCGAESRQ